MTYAYVSRVERPYWHVDMKWAVGIILFVVLSLGFLFYNLVQVTTRPVAVNVSAIMMARLLSDGTHDYTGNLDAIRRQATASPSDQLTPLDQFPALQVSTYEALHLKPDDLRLAIFNPLAVALYDHSARVTAAQFGANPSTQALFVRQLSVVAHNNQTAHNNFLKLLIICGLISALLMLLFVYFSAGWGRLVSPGVLLVLASMPGGIAAWLLLHGTAGHPSRLSTYPANVSQAVSFALGHSYFVALLAGISLLVVAALGKLVMIVIHRFRG